MFRPTRRLRFGYWLGEAPLELDVVLLWLVMFSAAALLPGGRGRLWTAKGAALLLLGAGAVWAAPLDAGWIVGCAWAASVAAPILLTYVANREMLALRYGAAAALNWAVWLLHPEPASRLQVETLAALRDAQRGRFDAAVARLGRIARSRRAPRPMALTALTHQRRLEGRLDELLDEVEWKREDPGQATTLRLAALATLGRAAELVAVQREGGWRLRAARDGARGNSAAAAAAAASAWALGLVSLFVGTGRVTALERLFAGPLRRLPAGVRAYQLALAHLAADEDVEAARATLGRLAAGSRDRNLARRAERALAGPYGGTGALAALSPADTLVVEEAEADFDRYLAVSAARPRLLRSPVTLALVGLNCAAFAAEIVLGGSEDAATLVRLGALWPPYVIQSGEWWRILAACFLHLGWVHLGVNMLALAVLGAAAERELGWWRMLLTYAAAGLGAMTGMVLLAHAGWMKAEPVVGASGAIMGLIGAQAAAAARGWRHSGWSRAAGQQLLWVVGVIALQAALDIATPQVSFAAHALGGAIGLCVAAALGQSRRMPAAAVTEMDGASAAPATPLDRTAAAVAGPGELPTSNQEAQAELLVGSAPPLPPTRLPRRRVALAAVGGGIGLASALAFPKRREQATARAEAHAAARSASHALTPVHLGAIRRLRFVFIDWIEAGALAVDPVRPFGSADALADLSAATGVTGNAALRRLYIEVMRLLPLFCEHARLAPGSYRVGEEVVEISAEQVRLVPVLSWRVPRFDDAVLARGGDAWPVTSVDFKRPYGDMTYFEADMADVLGLPVGADADGRATLPDDVLARLDALHRSMAVAMQVFARHAAWDGA